MPPPFSSSSSASQPPETCRTTRRGLRPCSRHGARAALLLGAALLAGCAWLRGPAPVGDVDSLLPADVLLLGEQHDAPEHHQLQQRVVEALAQRGQLAALALEMAESPYGTTALPRDAGEAAVRQALHWNDAAWPWRAYGPAVMAAVGAGVPVLGANLPRGRMRDAMADVSLDAQLPPEALAAQQDAIRDGHCGLLPATQILPMTRIQIARDRAMAHTLAEAAQPGRTVVLLAGAGHVDKTLGVPRHLPTELRVRALRLQAGVETSAAGDAGARFDRVWQTPAVPPVDHCAELRARMPPAAKQ